MSRTLPQHGDRFHAAAQSGNGTAVFHTQIVIGLHQQGSLLFPQQRFRRSLSANGIGRTRIQTAAQFLPVLCGVQHRCRLPQRRRVAAFAAEGEMGHKTGGLQHLHAALCKSLRRAHRPGQGQLQHQIGAAAHRRFRTGMLAHQGEVAPLHKAAAHGADNGGVRPQKGAGTLQLQQVSPVEGIVLCYNTSNGHVIPPKFMTKK